MLRSPLFPELSTVQDTLDRLIDSTLGDVRRRHYSSSTNGRTVPVAMPIDVYSTGDDVVILAEVPGMHPDDLDLTVNQNTITLSGTIRSAADSQEASKATWYVSEMSRGTYQRSITLPFAVNADGAQASMDSGILRVTLPKAESNRTRKISISSSANSSHQLSAKSNGGGKES
jgi:HSP20 family protein